MPCHRKYSLSECSCMKVKNDHRSSNMNYFTYTSHQGRCVFVSIPPNFPIDQCNSTFYDNCRNSRELIANFYCQYADRHMNLKFMRRVSVREPVIRQFVIVKNKLTLVFYASVLLLIMNFVITLSKSADPLGYRLVDPQLL